MTQANTTDEAYGADGSLLWRYTGSATDPNQRAFVPFEGGLLAEYYGGSPGGTLFDHPDELGSLSTAIDYATSHSAERLFYPFGEMWTGSDLYSLGMHQEFAKLPDYDNDSNSDLYNTLNRHYTPMGRWLSPDPDNAGADPSDPQTWNVYAYAGNNPTTNTDPTGEDYQLCVTAEDNRQTCTTYQNEEAFLATLQNPGPGITVQGNEASGTIYGTDVNGNSVQVGTYQYVPGPGTEGPGIQDATADLINTGYAISGVANLVKGAVGGISSFLGSMSGGQGAEITSLGIGRIVSGQTLSTVVQTAQGPLRIAAQVETQGSTIILKNLSVASPEGLGTVTNPGVGALKAAIDALKTTLRQNGFTQVQVQALRVTGANAPRLVNMTINLLK